MNYFIEVLKKYAVFTGRADRSEFWWFFLYSLLISVVLNVVVRMIHFQLLYSLWGLAILPPSIGVGIRHREMRLVHPHPAVQPLPLGPAR